ncbi:hypothetical protein O3G_MSEX002746 [Manduca sexta]|uniref:Gustatory receptor n=1 Tax=Manduca sexta TaxID=7130 RepID=A0A922CDX2_MANSE|nr:hypothetical protein O3G_MSEX002746 [Manduca sexta]
MLVNEIVSWLSQTHITLVEAMTLPTVRINTFIQTKSKPFVDILSKIYMIGGLLIGINRIPILTGNYILIVLSIFYSLSGVSAILYITFSKNNFFMGLILCLNVLSYVFCALYNLFSYKRMCRYYNEINKFDMEVGCRPKADPLSIRCYVQACVLTVYIIVLFFIPYGLPTLTQYLFHIIPVHVAVSWELHYYGHAISLLLPRLRLINYYMQLSLTTSKDIKKTVSSKYVFFKKCNDNLNSQMKKIMDLYYIAFQANNYLIAAVKWQLLMIIVASFISVLSYCYHFSLNIIRGEQFVDNMISDFGLIATLMVPMFAPCVSGSHIHNEINRVAALPGRYWSSRNTGIFHSDSCEYWMLIFRYHLNLLVCSSHILLY